MRRLLLLLALCMAMALVFAQVAVAQTRGPSGADGTYNCEDFDDQGQAQEFSLGDPDDTNGLDEDGDGTVCESLPTVLEGSVVPGDGEESASPSASPEASPTASPSASASASASASPLPETGGLNPAAFALPSLALLVAGGIFAARLMRG